MIDRREQALTYALLGVFSLIALAPIAGIVLTALQTPGELSSFGTPGGFHPRTSRRHGTTATSPPTCARA